MSFDSIPTARRFLPLIRPVARAINSLRGTRAPHRLTDAAGELCDIADRQDFVCDALSACDLLIAPSRFMRAKLLESGRFKSETIAFSDYGTEVTCAEKFNRTPSPDGRVRFGFIGSLLWYKGVDLLIRAMGQLGSSTAVLNVHGHFAPDADPYHAELARLAAENGTAIVFHGRFDNHQLAQIYQGIDVLVVPSIWFENSPLTIHESFVFETPVVTSNIGGMAELVRDGANGLHFAAGDAADLARVLRRFLTEPGLISTLDAFPRLKTMEEDARETEVRYRAAACVVRDHKQR
jgi:glycosyltransferase involved in cell wall biosynthesis